MHYYLLCIYEKIADVELGHKDVHILDVLWQ